MDSHACMESHASPPLQTINTHKITPYPHTNHHIHPIHLPTIPTIHIQPSHLHLPYIPHTFPLSSHHTLLVVGMHEHLTTHEHQTIYPRTSAQLIDTASRVAQTERLAVNVKLWQLDQHNQPVPYIKVDRSPHSDHAVINPAALGHSLVRWNRNISRAINLDQSPAIPSPKTD